MTNAEKALALVIKFEPHVNPYIGSGMLSNNIDMDAVRYRAKKCALLVCDEILELPFEHQAERAYWESIKQEILKL